MTILKFIIACLFLVSISAQAAEQTNELQLSENISAGQRLVTKLPDSIQNLLQYARSNEGVAYQRGGNSPESGFDCSGFVRNVYDHVTGIILPHGSKAMSELGDKIKTAELLPGDLVFFRFMNHTISHVGIYLGNNQFIHASSTASGSVMVSNLNDNYWAKHFSLARRFLNTSAHTGVVDTSPVITLKSKNITLN